jgi:hypothetical protein
MESPTASDNRTADSSQAKTCSVGVVLHDRPQSDENSGVIKGDHLARVLDVAGRLPVWAADAVGLVAVGATREALLSGERSALLTITTVGEKLQEACNIVLTDAGFAWTANPESRTKLPGGVFTGVELLDLALTITADPVALVARPADGVAPALAAHPEYRRIRVLSPAETHRKRDEGGRDDALASQLSGVGVVVIEYPLLSNLREVLRRSTSAPILDVATTVARWVK